MAELPAAGAPEKPGFVQGVTSLPAALQELLQSPGLWLRASVPIVVSFFLFVASAALGLLVARPWLETLVPEPTTTTPAAPREAGPSSAPTTTSPSPSTTTPTTTPVTPTASAFTLPGGTKLQRDDGDPAVVRELQRALSAAGYDPGPADGTFGRLTEAAVFAFQEANGLSVDGRVGPETASALNAALADG